MRVRPAARRVEERLGRLEEQRDGVGGVADLAVGQPAQGLGRVLDADLELLAAMRTMEAMAARSAPFWWATMVLMTGILQLGLVEVDDDVDLLAA